MTLASPLYSYFLVTLQFSLIGLILLTGAWFASGIGLILQVFGIFLALWAVQSMRLGKFNIIPDPKKNTPLVQSGPYRFIRHPMYAAILCIMTPLIILEPSILRLFAYTALILTLLFKLHYEERLLSKKFTEYSQYQKRSHKLIPFIF